MINIENPTQVLEPKAKQRTYQTGHAKNVSNLDTMITKVESFGAPYNPGKSILKLEGLKELSIASNKAISEVQLRLSAYTQAVTNRENAFEGFDQFITSITFTLKVYVNDPKIIEDVQRFARVLKGRRAVAKKTAEELIKMAENEKEVKYNSVSQMGYDSRVVNFEQLISYLKTIVEYTPNEPEMTIAGLEQKLSDLKAKNNAVINTHTALAQARNERNLVLYQPILGLYDVGNAVKIYIRGKFSLNSYEYKLVRNIKFGNRI